MTIYIIFYYIIYIDWSTWYDHTVQKFVIVSVTTRILGPWLATQERCQKDTPPTLSLKTDISKEQFIQKYAAFHNLQKYCIIQNWWNQKIV